MRGTGRLLQLVLPGSCPACGAHAIAGLCVECTHAAGELMLPDLGARRLADGVVAVGAFAYDGVVAAAVRGVKRPGRHAPAVGLGVLLWQVVGGSLPVTSWLRTWVPDRPASRRSRAAQIPRLLAGPCAQRLLAAPQDRADQTSLDARGRRANVVGSLVAVAPAPPDVVCVDDVRTTGATLIEAAGVLRGAGARRVLCVTFAVAGEEARASVGATGGGVATPGR